MGVHLKGAMPRGVVRDLGNSVGLLLKIMKNRLGLSCAKLKVSLRMSGFDLILVYFGLLTWMGFANFAYEFIVGVLILLPLKVWFGIFCRFCLVDFALFGLFEAVFILEVIFIFKVVFIFEVVFLFEFVFIFEV